MVLGGRERGSLRRRGREISSTVRDVAGANKSFHEKPPLIFWQ